MLAISILLGLEVIRYFIVEQDINILVGSTLVISLWNQNLPLAVIVLVIMGLIGFLEFINGGK